MNGMRALLAAAATTIPISVALAESGLEVVRSAIDYHGGAAYEASRVEARLCSGSGCYDLSVRQLGGLYEHRVEGPVRAGTRRVEADNDSVRAWLDGVELDVSSPSEAQRMRDWATARIYFAFLPYRLADPSARQEDLGLESWEGRELRKVKVSFRPGSSTDAEDEFLYWFDPETKRLEQFAYSYQGDPGGLRFRRLSNYRRLGGILFFDQQNLGVEGDEFGVEAIDPAFVHRRMRPVSEIRLEILEVEALR